MPILETDIKLLESERMTDTTDGGGRRTGNVIPDGEPGNIFPKVSRLDGVYGRVNLRKVYGAVKTASLDVYAGAHAVIMRPPANLNIVANLFSTGSDFDTRTAARDRIESYVIAGPESRMVLFGRQLVGQGAVQVYQRQEEPLPDVGDVLCLSKETGGVISYQQFVRVTDVEHEMRTLEDGQGTFVRRVCTLKLSTTLRYEFAGPESPSRYSNASRPAIVRTTTVADAARYYGIQALAEAADESDLLVRVGSVYSPIVPTTQRETAVSAATISGASVAELAGTSSRTFAWNDAGDTRDLHMSRRVKAGSLSLSVSNNASYLVTYADNGAGAVVRNGGSAAQAGRDQMAIDYETGVISFIRPSTAYTNWTVTISFQVEGDSDQPVHTRAIEMTLATRGTVHVQTLHPLPAAGTLIIDYRALGKWYRLRDDGAGSIGGDDPAYGVGTVDYVTGATVVTLGALPDMESSVIFSWGSPVHFQQLAGGTADAGSAVRQVLQAADLPIKPGTASLSFVSGGVTRTATANSSGIWSGSGVTGTLDHSTGAAELLYSTYLPDVGSTVSLTYDQLVPSNPSAPTAVSGSLTVTDPTDIDLAPYLGGNAIAVNSLLVSAPCQALYSHGMVSDTLRLADDGAGNLVALTQVVGNYWAQATIAGGQIVGTVNYATGAVAITTTIAATYKRWAIVGHDSIGQSIGSWVTSTVQYAPTLTSYSYAARTVAAAVDTPVTVDVDVVSSALPRVDLTRTSRNAVVPGSVEFVACGKRYIDRNGLLYTDLAANGTGIEAGTINYETGECVLSYWAASTLGLSVTSCLTVYGTFTTERMSFRTAGSPLRAGSLYVQVTSEDGELLAATSDTNGVISGPGVRGTVNFDMGTVDVEWGELVTAAGNEAEPWYHVSLLAPGGMIWKPRQVIPATLSYNCVVLSNLPLNADILGLDPVRLPSDGRVPIYRPADVVVVHHTAQTELTNPVTASATYSTGRTDLASLHLVDADGDRIPADQYVVDLAAGTVTMAASLSLGSYTQPLEAVHRIEELNLLSDVQINGQLTLTAPLSRDFPVGSYVSSALLFGDMVARVTGVFDQATWTTVWSDTLIGSQATGQYNDVDYPIEVLNNGCVTERWRINFTSSSAFQLIGEQLGVIATGTTGADLQPTNPLTGLPYFTLRAAGWGAGWAAGNQLRFNTIGATAPIWIARTVLPGATLDGDSLDMQLRGDVDAE